MSEQRGRAVADGEYMLEKQDADMSGGLTKIGTGLNKGWRKGASHSVELDFKARFALVPPPCRGGSEP